MEAQLRRRLQIISGHFEKQNSILQDCNAVLPNDGKELLSKERERASFNVRELAEILYGGKKNLELLEKTFKELEKEPIYSQISVDDLSKEGQRELAMARIAKVVELQLYNRSTEQRNIYPRVFYALDPAFIVRLGVHTGLFLGSITNNGTEYHMQKYGADAKRGKIYGSFAMTELGHGSNAGGLETTATYDKETKEFIIHSPTLTSTKWWIGGVAETSTHTVAFARLIIGEKDYGVHSFVVQLRDVKTHLPLPGITLGDCGTKLGLNGIDNGFIQFHNVRIPRQDMLDRYARVNEDGTYWNAGSSALALQRVALIAARAGIVMQSAIDGIQALTIAIRYGAVRRQFEDAPGNPEKHYQSHLFRLLIPLSEMYAYHFTAMEMDKRYFQLIHELSENNTTNLNDVHAIAAGMKAFSTWTARDAITLSRDCCGGHGYSSYNKVARLLQNFQVQTTWDGDNTVLAQQTAKFLIGSISKVMQGKGLKGSIKYLENIASILQSQLLVIDQEDLLKPEVQIAAFQWRTANICHGVSLRMQQELGNGKDNAGAWNSCLVDLIALAKAHCDLFKLEEFCKVVESTKNSQLYPTLKRVCDLYALSNIEKDFGTFRDQNYMSSDQARMVRQLVRNLCGELRSEAVSLVDAFMFPDWVLDSQIGSYDGNIYEKYFERVKKAQSSSPKPSYWEKLIKPLTQQE